MIDFRIFDAFAILGSASDQLERRQALELIDESTAFGARLKPVAQILGLTARTIQRWRRQECGEDRRRGPLTAPANKLTPAERQAVLPVANSSEYRELSPKQIVPWLVEEGQYVASESTFYHILRAENQP